MLRGEDKINNVSEWGGEDWGILMAEKISKEFNSFVDEILNKTLKLLQFMLQV